MKAKFPKYFKKVDKNCNMQLIQNPGKSNMKNDLIMFNLSKKFFK